ncbi:MAG: alpha/beta hydrolase [Lactobacillus sp.]|nr:alpha/beta hydrolase [Lactobacillus sp.]
MVQIRKDVIYDETRQLKTDIYYPNETTSDTKILIFWHGGGWITGDKDSLKTWGVDFANAGFMTFIPDYRLADQAKFPAAHEDALTFTKWLLASDFTDDDDQANIMQIGASCGGTMALYLAGLFGFKTVTWSAPVEFSKFIETHQDTVPSHDDNEAFYKLFTLAYTGSEDPQVLQKLDVKNYDLKHLGQLKMYNSTHELTSMSSVLDFIAALSKNDQSVILETIPGQHHAMGYAKQYYKKSLDFLRA